VDCQEKTSLPGQSNPEPNKESLIQITKTNTDKKLSSQNFQQFLVGCQS
jgi:hypothetical protein